MTLWRALMRFFRGDGMVFSGYLAFLSMLALLPVLGILFWFSQQSILIRTADAAFRDFLFTNLIPDAAKQVVSVVDKLRVNARGLGIVGIAIFVADALLKALALTTAVDRLWGGGKRRWWGFFNGAFVLLVLVPIVVGALYWFIRFLEKFFMNLFPSIKHYVDSAFNPIAIGVPLIAALMLLYRYVPPGVRSWRSPFFAAAVVTLLIEGARYVITHFIATQQQLKSLYGAFVAMPILLISTFVIWSLVLFGAALVAEGFGKNFRFAASRANTRPRASSAKTASPKSLATQ